MASPRAEQLNAELERKIDAQVAESNNEILLISFVSAVAVGASSQLLADNTTPTFWSAATLVCTGVSVIATVVTWRFVRGPDDVEPVLFADNTVGLDDATVAERRFVARMVAYRLNLDRKATGYGRPAGVGYGMWFGLVGTLTALIGAAV